MATHVYNPGSNAELNMIRRNEKISPVIAQSVGWEWPITATLFVLTLLFFSLFTFPVIPPGDASQNLYHILTRDLQPRPVFIGYTIPGILFTSIFSALGLPVDFGLSFMSAFFGALGAACGYLISLHLVKDRRIALTAVAIMVLSGVYWSQAEIADLYMTSYAFILLAMACFLNQRYLWAGGSYAAAVLAYPVAALVVPFFMWVAYRERIGIRNFLLFVLAGAALYLPVVLVTFQEYFFGRMGILPTLLVEPVPTKGELRLDLIRAVGHYGYLYAQSFNFLLLVVAYGVIDGFFRYRAVWSVAMSAALGPMVYGFLKAGTDLVDPNFLPAILFLSILASLSMWHLLSRLFSSRILQSLVITACLSIYGGLSYASIVGPFREDTVFLKQAFLRLERELPADAVLLSSWGISLAYNLYTRPFIYDQEYPDVMWTGRCQNIYRTTPQQIGEWLSHGRQIYFLDGVFWKNPVKETMNKILPQRIYARLSGTRSYTNTVLELNSRVGFVKMNTFTTGPLVLYQVLPQRELNKDGVSSEGA